MGRGDRYLSKHLSKPLPGLRGLEDLQGVAQSQECLLLPCTFVVKTMLSNIFLFYRCSDLGTYPGGSPWPSACSTSSPPPPPPPPPPPAPSTGPGAPPWPVRCWRPSSPSPPTPNFTRSSSFTPHSPLHLMLPLQRHHERGETFRLTLTKASSLCSSPVARVWTTQQTATGCSSATVSRLWSRIHQEFSIQGTTTSF